MLPLPGILHHFYFAASHIHRVFLENRNENMITWGEMHASSEKVSDGCSSCGGCGCRDVGRVTDGASSSLSGWAYVGWAAAIFILPVLGAIAGSALGGARRADQALGAALGLIFGALFARGLFFWRRPKV
jgi:hypothetical protein